MSQNCNLVSHKYPISARKCPLKRKRCFLCYGIFRFTELKPRFTVRMFRNTNMSSVKTLYNMHYFPLTVARGNRMFKIPIKQYMPHHYPNPCNKYSEMLLTSHADTATADFGFIFFSCISHVSHVRARD